MSHRKIYVKPPSFSWSIVFDWLFRNRKTKYMILNPIQIVVLFIFASIFSSSIFWSILLRSVNGVFLTTTLRMVDYCSRGWCIDLVGRGCCIEYIYAYNAKHGHGITWLVLYSFLRRRLHLQLTNSPQIQPEICLQREFLTEPALQILDFRRFQILQVKRTYSLYLQITTRSDIALPSGHMNVH